MSVDRSLLHYDDTTTNYGPEDLMDIPLSPHPHSPPPVPSGSKVQPPSRRTKHGDEIARLERASARVQAELSALHSALEARERMERRLWKEVRWLRAVMREQEEEIGWLRWRFSTRRGPPHKVRERTGYQESQRPPPAMPVAMRMAPSRYVWRSFPLPPYPHWIRGEPPLPPPLPHPVFWARGRERRRKPESSRSSSTAAHMNEPEAKPIHPAYSTPSPQEPHQPKRSPDEDESPIDPFNQGAQDRPSRREEVSTGDEIWKTVLREIKDIAAKVEELRREMEKLEERL
ncbi:uncharacterized protein VTP21DRAFT_7322 [Calcarisporiella thermophila]|uniref:uncharacterized protein n=1 Tax=Calcarisporiella thermophila TaxID=911321 RepID=UPI003741F39B